MYCMQRCGLSTSYTDTKYGGFGSGMVQAGHDNRHCWEWTQISLATGQIHLAMKIIQTLIYKSTVPHSQGIVRTNHKTARCI
jgi:hypothetical protein